MTFLQLFFTESIYNREALFSQPWRLWTAHWVHLGVWHWVLNAAALALLPEIFLRISWKHFLILWVMLPPLLSLALWFYLPNLLMYAGLSGVLHGLYLAIAMSAIVGASDGERRIGWIVLAGLLAKVGWEAYRGMSQTAELIGAPVILQAHQWGAVVGLFVWMLIWFVSKYTGKRTE